MIDADGLDEEIAGLPKKYYQILHMYLEKEYKNLNNLYTNNSTLFAIYTTILDYISSFLPNDKIPDIITMPQYVYIIATGIDLKEHLIVTIKRAPMYVGTDNPKKTTPFKNKVQKLLNHIDNSSLYTISLDGLVGHKTTRPEFQEFLNNLYN